MKTTNVRPGGTVLKSSEKKFDIVRACVNFICLMVVKLKNLTQDPTNAQRILGEVQNKKKSPKKSVKTTNVRPGGTVLKLTEKMFDVVQACVNLICQMVVKLKNLTQDTTNV